MCTVTALLDIKYQLFQLIGISHLVASLNNFLEYRLISLTLLGFQQQQQNGVRFAHERLKPSTPLWALHESIAS